MRPDLVVNVFPTEKIRPQAGDRPLQIIDVVKLLPMGPIAALDAAVEPFGELRMYFGDRGGRTKSGSPRC